MLIVVNYDNPLPTSAVRWQDLKFNPYFEQPVPRQGRSTEHERMMREGPLQGGYGPTAQLLHGPGLPRSLVFTAVRRFGAPFFHPARELGTNERLRAPVIQDARLES